MLFLLHGTDTTKARAKANVLVDSLLAKKPDAALVKVDDEMFDASHIPEWTTAQGLFEQKFIVFFDKVLLNKDAKETIIGALKEIESSDNVFVMLEESLDKKTLTKLEKHAQKVQEFGTKESAPKESFNAFALTDALGKRDKKQLWVLYQKALMHGLVPEELHGTLFWQVKSMILARTSRSADEAGLKPFVYNKAKGFAGNYSEGELENLSKGLVKVYHESRRGEGEFGVKLEMWVLSG